MYQCSYKSIYRCHTIGEVLAYDMAKIREVDLFLYLLDIYDLLLDDSCLTPEKETYMALNNKLEKFCFLNFSKLLSDIPGQMKGFTIGMFLYLILSLSRMKANNSTIIPENTRQWMRTNQVRSHQSYDTTDFAISDILDALDILELNWEKFPQLTSELLTYINALETRCCFFISCFCSENSLNIAKERKKVEENRYQISPAHIFEIYIRFIVMKRSFAQYTMFETVPSPQTLPENRWDAFLKQENRHLSIRKFRDIVADDVWENMVRLSDRYRASYKVRGSKVSAYQSIAENRPLHVLDSLSHVLAYASPDELHNNKLVTEALHLNLIHAYFQSTFSISFKHYFFCSEQKCWEHLPKLKTITVPIILERRKRYDVLYRSVIHLTPDGTFHQAFVYWLLLVRQDFNGILYSSMDFNKLCSFVLSIEVVDRAVKRQKLNNYIFE